MDILGEISRFNAENKELVRKFYPISHTTNKDSQDSYHQKSIINFCSNDYLRLAKNPEVISAGVIEMQNSGSGSGGTRNISGTNPLHNQLEKVIADFHEKEDCVLFNSAYNANVGALSTLGKHLSDVTFFSDEQNHASIIHGITLSRAKKVIYQHNSLEDLERKLSQSSAKNKAENRIIVCESVYSMSGNRTNIQKLVEISQKYNCLIYLDEVHAIGIYGNGRGVAFEDGLSEKIHIINGTLGKAVGCLGGYIATSSDITRFIKLNATTFIFSTSLPPFICAAAIKSLEIIAKEESLRIKFFQNVRLLKSMLFERKINILQNDSHIIIIPIHSITAVKTISHNLLEKHGIYIQSIFFPTVSLGKELLRITCCPQNTKQELELLAEALHHEMNNLGVMMDIQIIARKSILSRAQSEIFLNKIRDCYPQYSITESYISTFGDNNTHKPIHDLEYTNAFTKEIEEVLLVSENSIGVSSLKDIEIKGGEIKVECFLERVNPRDVLILSSHAKKKITMGKQTLRIGTSSIRRKYLFEELCKKILPNEMMVEIIPIRGNIDTRIKRLDCTNEKHLDGVILSVAGLLRLQSSEQFQVQYENLIKDKTFIILPITLFPTPPGQGIIATQTVSDFAKHICLVNHHETSVIAKKEKAMFYEYGKGCRQGFGVTALRLKNHECIFLRGIMDNGRVLNIIRQEGLENIPQSAFNNFCDGRKFSLYERTPIECTIPTHAKNFFVATKHAVHDNVISHLKNANEVWAAGVGTHEFLVQNGILCNGSVESLGFEQLGDIRMPINSDPFYTLTYQPKSQLNNQQENVAEINSFEIHTYSMELTVDSQEYQTFCIQLQNASSVLWTSLQMFQDFHHLTQEDCHHISMLGKTYDFISKNKKNVIGIFNFEVLDSLLENNIDANV